MTTFPVEKGGQLCVLFFGRRLIGRLAEKSNKTKSFWAKKVKHEDFYINADTAIKLGLAHTKEW